MLVSLMFYFLSFFSSFLRIISTFFRFSMTCIVRLLSVNYSICLIAYILVGRIGEAKGSSFCMD